MAAESFIGKTIGKYQIVEHLGRGGMAEVYKAYQPALDRYVAIKLMHSFLAEDEDFLGRFQREARSVASLRHPNIVQVYDFDVADGIYYMVMEFIDGDTLKAKLQELAGRNEAMPLEEALRIARGVASALAYAHKRDMVHRDVKPANVMLNRDGQVILTDFGIAKILSGPQYTASGAMIGTPAYMSPEQGLGKPGDARSDIYSLGTMLFQMATGQLPYDADTPLAVVLKHVNDPMPIPSRLNPGLDPAVERVIFKAMAKNPEDRYQTADELVAHIDRVQAGQSIPDVVPTAIPSHPPISEPAATMVAAPPTMRAPIGAPGVQGTAAPSARAKRSWLVPVMAVGVILVLALAAGLAFGMPALLNGRNATPTESSIAGGPTSAPTDTPEPPTVTATPAPTATPLDLVAAASTALAQQNATLTAQAPTATATSSPTPQPSPTPVPVCTLTYELSSFYTYDNPATYNAANQRTSAPVNATFQLTIDVVNQGTCDWETGTQLVLSDGDALGAEDVVLEQAVPAGEEVSFELDMVGDSVAGEVISTWQLQTPAGEPIGEPFEVTILLYTPATPTPTRPAQPTATPTSASADLGPIDFNYFVSGCEYAGSDWRCWLTLTPYGGIGQPYTFFVFDSAQPARYYGGNADHLMQARRCSAWIHEVKLQDDGGNAITKNVYVSPNDYFPGGCTEP